MKRRLSRVATDGGPRALRASDVCTVCRTLIGAGRPAFFHARQTEIIAERRWCDGLASSNDVVVEAAGELVTPSIEVDGELVVHGVVLTSGARVDRLVLAHGCVWSGDCSARTIVIEGGAEIRSGKLRAYPNS